MDSHRDPGTRCAQNFVKWEGLASLEQQVLSLVPVGQHAALKEFLSLFFAVTTPEELGRYSHKDLVGGTLSFWRFLQKIEPGQSRVTVLNPEYENHGWHSNHTIVQIVHPDIPYIVDSVRMKLNAHGATIHHLRSCVFSVERDAKGQFVAVAAQGDHKESLLYLEVDRLECDSERDALRQQLESVLADTRQVAADYRAIRSKVSDLADGLLKHKDNDAPSGRSEHWREAGHYLAWLAEHFVFLAYQSLEVDSSSGQPVIKDRNDQRLGLLRSDTLCSQWHLDNCCNNLDAAEGAVLAFAKVSVRSRIHRPAWPDLVLVRDYDKKGRLVGLHRVVGLYTPAAHALSPYQIPWLRCKLADLRKNAGFPADSHLGKELDRILYNLPREELFLTPPLHLLETVMGIIQIQERNQVRVFIRRDVEDQFCSVLVYVPREVYDTTLRLKIQNILCRHLDAVDVEFTTFFSESILARVHYVLRLADGNSVAADLQAIRADIHQAACSWEGELKDCLIRARGEVEGKKLFRSFSTGFPVSYRDSFTAPTAVADAETMLPLSRDAPMAMRFYQLPDHDEYLHLKVFYYNSALSLSDLLPILENLGLRVLSEHPYRLRRDDQIIYLHDFTLSLVQSQVLPLRQVSAQFQDAFECIWHGQAENDRFNRLVLMTGMTWRQVTVFRAYARYMKQIQFGGFSQSYIAETLCGNGAIARQIFQLFEVSFDPDLDLSHSQRLARRQHAQQQIRKALDDVCVLSEDRILRRYMELMVATLRTNYYQKDGEGQWYDYLCLKFSPPEITDIPKPAPVYEIFVYSPTMEGVHMRAGKVARGGLRWSDRVEDFRTEILGLVKAQKVKNAVIVPVGAKGGFVPKRLSDSSFDGDVAQEGKSCYKTFIRALLDVTDNLVEGEVIHPPRVVRYDDDDTYLVVAADKGTATLSDTANEIAASYNFWLGDAFASGGSAGYDHKKMAITARGAWVSVQQHFREKGVNVQTDPVTVVGVGDMSGDVFGNGMLSSDKIKLVAAFNHMHIFVDPDPDPAVGFAERQRLFTMQGSCWADYKSELISEGGGVFSRGVKSISLTAQMKKLFNVRASRLTPNELISLILKAQVDLIWVGGIGTYVKSSTESHADVGDKANDPVRVDGRDVRARVLSEGGNLGFTQLGRIEYALNGGALNTDFMDNSGGVDCSDHEVNIKILLNSLVASGDMTRKQRDRMLEGMTDDVASLVLVNTYRQVRAVALAERECAGDMEEYARAIHKLEEKARLDRGIEFLPDEEQFRERQHNGQGLTRPELSVLISYSKAALKEQLLASTLPDDPCLTREMDGAFPAVLVKKYRQHLGGHGLRREIVATQLANYLVNMMGITFVDRLERSIGVDTMDVVRGFFVARDVFGAEQLWASIERLDHVVETGLQHELMSEVARLLRWATRWLVKMKELGRGTGACVEHYRERILWLMDNLEAILPECQCQAWRARVDELTQGQVPEALARRIAGVRHFSGMLSIVQTADQTGQPLTLVATVFFAIGEFLELPWLSQKLSNIKVSNYWHSMAREGLRDELACQQRALSVSLLQLAGDADAVKVEDLMQRWSQAQQAPLARWRGVIAELQQWALSHAGKDEFALYMVGVRELLELAQSRS
ncbi:MAG: NAD-glutamate dehydrogenase [Kistimonas sp.]|nr:NAD-glutamate dehydrogenase [Kistimonas sp.]